MSSRPCAAAARREVARREVVVIGAGFGGSLLARLLARAGRDVLLVERDRHPRFALGESTTPLANLVLERLALRYRWPELWSLAAWGRWRRDLPQLRAGLKRGFTFYRHEAERPFGADPDNRDRLLVAASPDDAIADTQWLRADVDAWLVEQAIAAGVEYRDGTRLVGAESVADGLRLELVSADRETSESVEATLVVDAAGAGGALAPWVDNPDATDRVPFRSWLLYGHFEGIAPLAAVTGLDTASDPYPEAWAAVHQLTPEGWMYQLRFDHGVTSAGWLVPGLPSTGRIDPGAELRRRLARYPSLAAQFEGARPVVSPAATGPVQQRRARTHGAHWVLLPHSYAFFDPLYSTGLAWSLLGVERLADRLCGEEELGTAFLAETLEAYGSLLEREADHLQRLIGVALSLVDDFELFVPWSWLYFVAASWQESRQRLLDPPGGRPSAWGWQGFLGADDAELVALCERLRGRLERLRPRAPGGAAGAEFAEEVRRAAEPRNVAGLGDPARRNLYPVDLDALRSASSLLGLSRDELELRLPRLRGASSYAAARADEAALSAGGDR